MSDVVRHIVVDSLISGTKDSGCNDTVDYTRRKPRANNADTRDIIRTLLFNSSFSKSLFHFFFYLRLRYIYYVHVTFCFPSNRQVSEHYVNFEIFIRGIFGENSDNTGDIFYLHKRRVALRGYVLERGT